MKIQRTLQFVSNGLHPRIHFNFEGLSKDLLTNFQPDLIRTVRLFDVYAGKPVPAGKKSLSFTLTYRADDRTLTDEEVNSIQTRVVAQLSQRFGGQLRGQEGVKDHGDSGD